MNRKIDKVGRIVIPKEILNGLNIQEEDKLNIQVIDEQIILTKKMIRT